MSPQQIKPRQISGFPEWLPSEKLVEDRFLEIIRAGFESYGYTPIETAAVELTEVLSSKGVDQKEIYSLVRLHAEAEEAAKKELSLHFDLTVPFARYVALHKDRLVFPFKRYQIQKVWRGERPAQGRFREFYQCDIDAVGIEELPLTYDAELLEVVGQIFSRLSVGKIEFRLNSRKLIEGYYRHLGLDPALLDRVLLEVDKLAKTGAESVARQITALGVSPAAADGILSFAGRTAPPERMKDTLGSMGVGDPLFIEGMEELCRISSLVPPMENVSLCWNGSITRGLNYYTGTVFETALEGVEELGSICSGGRYDTLAGRFCNTPLPGVGISIGLTRLLSHLFLHQGLAEGKPSSPSEILIANEDESMHQELSHLARRLRASGRKVEVYHASKLKKQLAYADRKGIPFVIIPAEDKGSFVLKEMASGRQQNMTRELLICTCKNLSPG